MILPVPSKQDIKQISLELQKAFNETIFEPLSSYVSFVMNSEDTIQRELDEGKIEYVDGVLKGAFSIKSIKYIEGLNQKWDGAKRGYIITDPSLNALIGSATSRFLTAKEQIQRFLASTGSLELGLADEPFDKTIDNVVDKSKKNIDQKSSVRTGDIKQEFKKSVNVSSVAFMTMILLKLRKDVIEAKSNKDLKDAFELRQSQARIRADGLADDSGHYFSGIARREFYKAQGIKYFKWITRGDNKVRESHRAVNGEIFSYSEPPIIDGVPTLPSQAYGCRCVDFPIKEVERNVE